MHKFITIIGLVMMMSMVAPPKAHAHFYVSDPDTKLRTLFHVTPDHEPIAGGTSIISFDFTKSGHTTDDFSYRLSVKSNKTEIVTVPVHTEGNIVLADYSFPSQGLYRITLAATPKTGDKTPSEMSYSQRVSKGYKTNNAPISGLEVAIIIATLAVAAVAILATSGFKFSKRAKG